MGLFLTKIARHYSHSIDLKSNFPSKLTYYAIGSFLSKIQVPVLVLGEPLLKFFLVGVSVLLFRLRQTFMVIGTVIAPYHLTVK